MFQELSEGNAASLCPTHGYSHYNATRYYFLFVMSYSLYKTMFIFLRFLF